MAPNSHARRAAVAVERLVDVPELDLTLLCGSAHAEIDWVHSSDLADPTPFLAPGNLLLTTGQQFASNAGPDDYLDYVQRLVEVGVRAVGFGTDVVRSATPQDLIAACLSCDLPLLEVPYRTPFIAISRWVADALAAQARERDLWTLQAQRAVALAGLSKGRVVAVLDELARQLEARVALLDGHGDRLSEHGTPRPDWSALEVEARRLLERGLRGGSSLTGEDGVATLYTLGRRQALRGVLVVVTPDRLDAAATAVVTSAVALAEVALEDAGRQRSRSLGVQAQLLDLLLSGHQTAVRDALAAGGQQLPATPLQVLLIGVNPQHAADLERSLELRSASDGQAVFCAPWRDCTAVLVEERWCAAALTALRRYAVTVGVSPPTSYSALAAALVRAEDALSRSGAAGIVEGDPERDAILGLLHRADVVNLARHRLAPLLQHPDGPELLGVVEIWLRHDGHWDPAARALGLHRHTLKAQVQRAAALLELPLDTFAAKAELWALLVAH